MTPPAVSVILPTYNRCQFLGEAILSALSQTADNLEVLVVDDGSIDGTPDLLDQFCREDRRVRAFRQENAGVSAARNRALSEVRGKYIAFLDSDDVWKPWKLELQLALFNACPEIGMVWTNMDAVDFHGDLLYSSYLKKMYSAYNRLEGRPLFAEMATLGQFAPELDSQWGSVPAATGNIYRQMFQGNLVHTPTVLVRKEWADKAGQFDTSIRRGGEDFKFHLATCRQGSVGFLDAPAILYRVESGDNLTCRDNNLHFAWAFLNTLENELEQNRGHVPLKPAEVRHILAHAYEWVAGESCSRNLRSQAILHALKSILLNRRIDRNWKTLVKALLPNSMLKKLSNRRPPQTVSEVKSPSPPVNTGAELVSHSN